MVYVMLQGRWIEAKWDASKVGCWIDGKWFNMATFEAYCFTL